MARIRGLIQRLWPRRLAGQLIALLLLALILAQLASFWVFLDERRAAIRTAERGHVLERTASIVRLTESTPPALHEQIVRTASSPQLRFWLADESAVEADEAEPTGPIARRLARRLAALSDDDGDRRRVLIEVEDDHDHWWREGDGDHARGGDEQRDWRHRHFPASLVIATRLTDGRWLNVALRLRAGAMPWAGPSLLAMVLTAVALSVIVVLMVRRITRPMAGLAAAAERIGRGEATPPLAEDGPLDVRQTTRAFNRMQDRLQRFVRDRTRMLAAISHDLRTPITTLRLRAEFVDDDETRVKILETLDEMQRMTEATLAFAREEAAREATRTVDLAALVDSVCADLADLGMDVSVDAPAKTPYACRPVSLKRAIRNLVENAVRYGERARVRVRADASDHVVEIDDDGPGIPDADAERVFTPFVRLEESRSEETGGIGLGMAIARSIVRGHGGDITLANRSDGGLRATIRLPGRNER